MLWTLKVLTRVELYSHWQEREVAEKIKRENSTHQELDRLREAMIFGEAEGDAYWSVILQLNEEGWRENPAIRKSRLNLVEDSKYV